MSEAVSLLRRWQALQIIHGSYVSDPNLARTTLARLRSVWERDVWSYLDSLDAPVSPSAPSAGESICVREAGKRTTSVEDSCRESPTAGIGHGPGDGLLERQSVEGLTAGETAIPIPMVLYCPYCSTQHIDAPDGKWTNPPHRSHLCKRCGAVWRPCDQATVGVVAITSKGLNDHKPKVRARHPMQPLVRTSDDVVRFKQNGIVRFLLDASPYDMNRLATMSFTREDREQFAQLIGYSVSGLSELSHVSRVTIDLAEDMVERLFRTEG